MDTLTIIRPDDLHLHLRDGAALASVIAPTARQFARAIVMPNLNPPVTTVEQALAYRKRILEALPPDSHFEPLMTLYLTDNTSADEIDAVADSEFVHALKYYPAGATTNSDRGVTDIHKVYKVLERMEQRGVPLLVHGEVTDPAVDTFDREQVFIDQVLVPLLKRFTALKLVFEHITTAQAAQFVGQGPENIAATITPQHLLYNRNSLFKGGLRPHMYCLPVLKREQHRQAVVQAATGGNPRFFLGTDSAPHARSTKETACGCAGIYSAPCAIELYAEVFDTTGCLDRLEAFASLNGARFYGLPVNRQKITLARQQWEIPASLPFADGEIVPLRAGETCQWKLVATHD